jgi:uncharacterized protein
MKIANQFSVSAPIEQAWDVLCDLEQVIPLMPGAQLVGHEGDDYLGKVKVKVGPVTSEFTGKVRFVEQDRDQHRAVIDGKGKESRGTGNAAATVTAQLRDDGDRTHVTVDTDLKIVGKLAQFGSGMLQQVSEKLLGQFVESFEAKLTAESAGKPGKPGKPGSPGGYRGCGKARRGSSPSPYCRARAHRSAGARRRGPAQEVRLRGGGGARRAGADLGVAAETLAAREHSLAAARRRSGGVCGSPGGAPAQCRGAGVRQRPNEFRAGAATLSTADTGSAVLGGEVDLGQPDG